MSINLIHSECRKKTRSILEQNKICTHKYKNRARTRVCNRKRTCTRRRNRRHRRRGRMRGGVGKKREGMGKEESWGRGMNRGREAGAKSRMSPLWWSSIAQQPRLPASRDETETKDTFKYLLMVEVIAGHPPDTSAKGSVRPQRP